MKYVVVDIYELDIYESFETLKEAGEFAQDLFEQSEGICITRIIKTR